MPRRTILIAASAATASAARTAARQHKAPNLPNWGDKGKGDGPNFAEGPFCFACAWCLLSMVMIRMMNECISNDNE